MLHKCVWNKRNVNTKCLTKCQNRKSNSQGSLKGSRHTHRIKGEICNRSTVNTPGIRLGNKIFTETHEEDVISDPSICLLRLIFVYSFSLLSRMYTRCLLTPKIEACLNEEAMQRLAWGCLRQERRALCRMLFWQRLWRLSGSYVTLMLRKLLFSDTGD